MKSAKRILRSIIQACPYTLVGKKCVDVAKGTPKPKIRNRSTASQLGIRTGRNIVLVGIFCPFLWYSILSGSSAHFITLNLIHSGVIVGIGLIVMAFNYFIILRPFKRIK